MSALLDMSQIPMPAAVELLDYETIRAEWLADYAARMETTVAALDLNDPAVRVLETGAYRELLRRAASNDSVRATLLAHAWGKALDDLGNDPLYGGLQRLTLDPGDPDAVPPVPPEYESDTDYKARLALAPHALSVAGPEGAYEVLARSAHPDALDVRVTSPSGSNVTVAVLHTSDDAAILTKIAAALSAKNVRPIGDRVSVVAAAREPSSAVITLYVYDGPDLEAVRAASQARVNRLALPQARKVASGASLLADGGANTWLGACMVEGAKNWALASHTGMATGNAWWPMTITVNAVRANA